MSTGTFVNRLFVKLVWNVGGLASEIKKIDVISEITQLNVAKCKLGKVNLEAMLVSSFPTESWKFVPDTPNGFGEILF